MKFLIAFSLLLCMISLTPSVLLATTNPQNSIVNSTVLHSEKLSFKKLLFFKTSKIGFINYKNEDWFYSLLFIFIGILLLGLSIPLQNYSSTSIGIVTKPLIWVAALIIAVLGFLVFLLGLLKLMEYFRTDEN